MVLYSSCPYPETPSIPRATERLCLQRARDRFPKVAGSIPASVGSLTPPPPAEAYGAAECEATANEFEEREGAQGRRIQCDSVALEQGRTQVATKKSRRGRPRVRIDRTIY